MTELTESEILAISLMAAGQEMTETVKKSDLVSIIALLMRKLNWVVEDKESILRLKRILSILKIQPQMIAQKILPI